MVSRRVATVLVILLTHACVSCALSPFASRHEREQQAIQFAKQEIARRSLPLPPDYTVKVSLSESGSSEEPPSRPVYGVTFYAKLRGYATPAPYYTVSIQRYTGILDGFEDHRRNVTDEEKAAFKRVMIQHVGGAPDDFSLGVGPSGDHVEAWITDERPGRGSAEAHVVLSRKNLKVIKFEWIRKPSNQAIQPTASRRTASLSMINTCSFQATLVAISGG
jgi:hypothetical protein